MIKDLLILILFCDVQQYLSQNVGDNKRALIDCRARWHEFKHYLYKHFVRPYLEMPNMFKHEYKFITQDVWDDFIRQRLNDEFYLFIKSQMQSWCNGKWQVGKKNVCVIQPFKFSLFFQELICCMN